MESQPIRFFTVSNFVPAVVKVFPGLFLVVTTLAFNLLGDGLRDALDVRSDR